MRPLDPFRLFYLSVAILCAAIALFGAANTVSGAESRIDPETGVQLTDRIPWQHDVPNKIDDLSPVHWYRADVETERSSAVAEWEQVDQDRIANHHRSKTVVALQEVADALKGFAVSMSESSNTIAAAIDRNTREVNRLRQELKRLNREIK